jgi:hypothetical protein
MFNEELIDRILVRMAPLECHDLGRFRVYSHRVAPTIIMSSVKYEITLMNIYRIAHDSRATSRSVKVIISLQRCTFEGTEPQALEIFPSNSKRSLIRKKATHQYRAV